MGSQPRDILAGVLREGVVMAVLGVVAGVAGGLALWRVAGSMIAEMRLPGPLPVAGAAGVLLVAAVIASLMPAARAARVDAVQALRAE